MTLPGSATATAPAKAPPYSRAAWGGLSLDEKLLARQRHALAEAFDLAVLRGDHALRDALAPLLCSLPRMFAPPEA